MDLRECEILDLGTARRNGGKSSARDCHVGIDQDGARNAGTNVDASSDLDNVERRLGNN